jgi:hypothetical protein
VVLEVLRCDAGGDHVNKNTRGLLDALRQAINEAILESNDVAVAMAALKRTGKCPVFTIDVALEDAPEAAVETLGEEPDLARDLVLSDSDEEFLRTLGIVHAE